MKKMTAQAAARRIADLSAEVAARQDEVSDGLNALLEELDQLLSSFGVTIARDLLSAEDLISRLQRERDYRQQVLGILMDALGAQKTRADALAEKLGEDDLIPAYAWPNPQRLFNPPSSRQSARHAARGRQVPEIAAYVTKERAERLCVCGEPYIKHVPAEEEGMAPDCPSRTGWFQSAEAMESDGGEDRIRAAADGKLAALSQRGNTPEIRNRAARELERRYPGTQRCGQVNSEPLDPQRATDLGERSGQIGDEPDAVDPQP